MNLRCEFTNTLLLAMLHWMFSIEASLACILFFIKPSLNGLHRYLDISSEEPALTITWTTWFDNTCEAFDRMMYSCAAICPASLTYQRCRSGDVSARWTGNPPIISGQIIYLRQGRMTAHVLLVTTSCRYSINDQSFSLSLSTPPRWPRY